MEFETFPKIARLKRGIVITEKIDGTNAQVLIRAVSETVPSQDAPAVAVVEGLAIFAGSRTRYITPESDNFGFARWVKQHAEDLATLGPGTHFGEWWGNGIQRGYGLQNGDKRFSLFNVSRWRDGRPACCHVVPVLYEGDFSTNAIEDTLRMLAEGGSAAAPGFMKPEGVVVFHGQSRTLFKKTIEKDDEPKARHQPAIANVT